MKKKLRHSWNLDELAEKARTGHTSRKNTSFALPMIFLEGGGTNMAGFEKLLVVRGLRLLRLARVLRMVGRFKVGSSRPAMGGLMRTHENT